MARITIFAKKRTTKEGREFTSYLTRLTRKDGSEQTMTAKFKEDDGPRIEDCPLNIEVDKSDMNISKKKYEQEDGTESVGYTLWIKAWSESEEQWLDASLDEFEFND